MACATRRSAAQWTLALKQQGFCDEDIVEAVSMATTYAEALDRFVTGALGEGGREAASDAGPAPKEPTEAAEEEAHEAMRPAVGPLRLRPTCKSPGCGRSARRSAGAFAPTCCVRCPVGHGRGCEARRRARQRAGIAESGEPPPVERAPGPPTVEAPSSDDEGFVDLGRLGGCR